MRRGSYNLFPFCHLEMETRVLFKTLGGCFKNKFNRPVFRTAIYGLVCYSLYEGSGWGGRWELSLSSLLFTVLCLLSEKRGPFPQCTQWCPNGQQWCGHWALKYIMYGDSSTGIYLCQNSSNYSLEICTVIVQQLQYLSKVVKYS